LRPSRFRRDRSRVGLVEEWFWLWPSGRKGDTETQLRHSWMELAKSGSPLAPAALHNLAVTAHLNALEADHSGNSVATAWKSAYGRWRQVLADERCWEWLEARVAAAAAADPRLTSSTVCSTPLRARAGPGCRGAG
jgi:hypothetical protein